MMHKRHHWASDWVISGVSGISHVILTIHRASLRLKDLVRQNLVLQGVLHLVLHEGVGDLLLSLELLEECCGLSGG